MSAIRNEDSAKRTNEEGVTLTSFFPRYLGNGGRTIDEDYRKQAPSMCRRGEGQRAGRISTPAHYNEALYSSVSRGATRRGSHSTKLPPPPRAEGLSSICLIQGVNNNLLDLDNLLEATGVSVPPVSVRATRKRGDFKLSGLVPEDWPKLKTLAESLDPLNQEMAVLVRAPLSYTRCMDSAVFCRCPYLMEVPTFVLSLQNSEPWPCAAAPVLRRDGSPSLFIKLWYRSKSQAKKVLRKKFLRLTMARCPVSRPRSSPPREEKSVEGEDE